MAIEIERNLTEITETPPLTDQTVLLEHAGKIAVWSTFYVHRDIGELRSQLDERGVDPQTQKLIEGNITSIISELDNSFISEEGQSLKEIATFIDRDHY